MAARSAGPRSAPLAQPPTGNPFVAVALEKAAADAVTPEVVEKVNKPAIGGPLYPPVHAIFYAPLGFIDDPQHAYRFFQLFSVFAVLFSRAGREGSHRADASGGRSPRCASCSSPACAAALDLGQNPTLSLCILVWGWVLASRGYLVAGGMVWGLFAFKPVWGLAFFLVPLLMRKWRFCVAMVLTGVAFGAITLPFVGLR